MCGGSLGSFINSFFLNHFLELNERLYSIKRKRRWMEKVVYKLIVDDFNENEDQKLKKIKFMFKDFFSSKKYMKWLKIFKS